MFQSEGLICPLDGAPLSQLERTLRCINGHSFDMAKQGYCNLLPVQNKRSTDPGDSKEMVKARTEFLSAGLYEPIASQSVTLLSKMQPERQNLKIADAGCGDGYYLNYIRERLIREGFNPRCIGYDISKWAVQAACKRNKADLSWLVASSKQPPIEDNYLDVLLCMFGFPVYEQFARVLKTGGMLLLVDAGSDHLIELRQILYPSLKPHRSWKGDSAGQAGFEVVAELVSNPYKIELNQSLIQQLLLMTPHFFRASAEARERLSEIESLELTVDAEYRWLKRGR